MWPFLICILASPLIATTHSMMRSLFRNDTAERRLFEDSLLSYKNGIRDQKFRWPYATVIYKLDASFSDEERTKILSGWEDISASSCIKFKEYVSEPHFVFVKRGIEDGKNGTCSSTLGYQPGDTCSPCQNIVYSKRCIETHGTIIHEMLHTLGFAHEHKRPDRDEYVTVVFDKIQPGKKGSFEKMSEEYFTTFGLPYDYDSVLHYSRNHFSIDGSDTLIPKVPHVEIGQRVKLSELDVMKINLMYCSNKD